MQPLLSSLFIAFIVYAYTFKEEYEGDDLGIVFIGTGIIFGLVLLTGILGG